MKKRIIFYACTIFFLSTGCATRHFVINSTPEDALILGGMFLNDKVSTKNVKQTFIGKSDNCKYIAMHRGYAPDTITVTKDSPPNINFNLTRLDGISTEISPMDELTVENIYILPVEVDIVLHKGIGNLDKYERSDELSSQAYTDLNNELKKMQRDTTISVISLPESYNLQWNSLSEKLSEYLKTLRLFLLKYYPEPPSVKNIFLENRVFSYLPDSILKSEEKQYIVYGFCKSVKPTSGRIIGNMLATVAGGAVEGYEMATYGHPVSYQNPEAFNIDYNTLFVAYIIDPASGEVLDIRQHAVAYDITKPEKLQNFAQSILFFPKIKKSTE